MSRWVVTDESGRPDWRRPALRVGLEISLVALVAGYVAVHLSSPLVVAAVVVAAVVGSAALLFRALDRQAYAWVRYASERARESQRKQRRERAQRRQRRQQGSEPNQPRQSSDAEE
ncbi:hypothetical protein [Halosimplex halophilum]|uniref:hypothetical protein n=1 Tax=Halosimplex halophilum TaxID=2559572 RepID=UPI00107F6289|nr:hypothetical protein [Halosimplex halophilum]